MQRYVIHSWTKKGGERVWQVLVLENLNYWEIEEYGQLLNTLFLASMDGNNDSPQWSLTMNESVMVKYVYKSQFKHGGNRMRFSDRQIWKTSSYFIVEGWEVSKECILTINHLRKREKILVNVCYFCKKAEESCNHVLLQCPVAY